MKRVFADAPYFVALLSARDRWHSRAVTLNRQPPGPLVTTEWVLIEVGDAFSLPSSRLDRIYTIDEIIVQILFIPYPKTP